MTREPFPINASPAVPELSRDAIAARREAKRKTGREGGWTGRELIGVAGRNLQEANRLRKVADRRVDRRREKAMKRAVEALVTAAVQVRVAQATPLDKPYLHALSLDRIQTIRAEVAAALEKDDAELAVDTHRRVQDQRNRTRAEAGG